MENAIKVGGQDSLPGVRRHGGQQGILVAAGIVDQHVQSAVAREDFIDRLLPGFGRGDVQDDRGAPIRLLGY